MTLKRQTAYIGREINDVGSEKRYKHNENPGKNKIVVKRLEDFEGVEVVLYTSIGVTIERLTGKELAKRAIASVMKADPGRDGISYLLDAIDNGISTRLTAEYKAEILQQTNTASLEQALASLK